MSSHFKGTLFKIWNFQQFKTAANSMLESEGDRSLDAAEDAGRPGCFRAIPVGLAHVLLPVSGRIGHSVPCSPPVKQMP
jgi:hypothetical protein